jgi:CheY-like chemotaxis protein
MLNDKKKEYLETKRILLVDDNELLLELGSECIKTLGYQVSTAKNGKEAIHLTEENHFDLILLDIQMPILNGFQTIKILKDRDDMPPIIALTCLSTYKEQQELHKAGFTDVLTKPYTLNECSSSITRAL